MNVGSDVDDSSSGVSAGGGDGVRANCFPKSPGQRPRNRSFLALIRIVRRLRLLYLLGELSFVFIFGEKY